MAVGEITTDDLNSYMGAIIAEEAMPYGKIFDIREATGLTGADRLAEVGATVRLYDKMKLGEIGPLAIVATAAEGVAHARAFLNAAEATRPTSLFLTIEEAEAWLRRKSDR
jgi:hypothetical protein